MYRKENNPNSSDTARATDVVSKTQKDTSGIMTPSEKVQTSTDDFTHWCVNGKVRKSCTNGSIRQHEDDASPKCSECHGTMVVTTDCMECKKQAEKKRAGEELEGGRGHKKVDSVVT